MAEAVFRGEPSAKVGRHLLARLRVADRSLVLPGVPPEGRETPPHADSAAFVPEPHDACDSIVLVRRSPTHDAQVAAFLRRR